MRMKNFSECAASAIKAATIAPNFTACQLPIFHKKAVRLLKIALKRKLLTTNAVFNRLRSESVKENIPIVMLEVTIPTIRPRVSLLAKSPTNDKIIFSDTMNIPNNKSAADNI